MCRSDGVATPGILDVAIQEGVYRAGNVVHFPSKLCQFVPITEWADMFIKTRYGMLVLSSWIKCQTVVRDEFVLMTMAVPQLVSDVGEETGHPPRWESLYAPHLPEPCQSELVNTCIIPNILTCATAFNSRLIRYARNPMLIITRLSVFFHA